MRIHPEFAMKRSEGSVPARGESLGPVVGPALVEMPLAALIRNGC